ncbi:cyclin-Q-like [Diadema setosum]|uniref:cyclin-Q-like n=1 Tax=Diadema setosum TaxID=31175 RepID=UPI003B3B5D45
MSAAVMSSIKNSVQAAKTEELKMETGCPERHKEVKKRHFKVLQYMMEAGIKLHLESVTLASACSIYHRFFAECRLSDYDPFLIGATAIYLATKVEEQHIKLRDIVNVCYRILHKDGTPLEVGKHYWELRDSIVNCELLLIRMLKYNPKVGDLPHKYLVHYLKSMADWFDPATWTQTPVCRTAWAMLRDSYHGDIGLRTKPQHMAVAVLYFSLQCYGLEVPLNTEAKVPWWKAFSDDIDEDIIQGIITELMELYDLGDQT